jgi:hypothetical protein
MRVHSPGDFLRRIAFDYVAHGYVRYVVRTVPVDKSLSAIDRKMITTYQVTTSRMKRLRDRQQGLAAVQYLRFENTWILLATPGRHPEFAKLKSRDIRTTPLHIGWYSIGIVGGKPSVAVRHKLWQTVERAMYQLTYQNTGTLTSALVALPYYQFPGVIQQKQQLLAALNQKRRAAGLPVLDPHLFHVQKKRFRR